MLFFTEKILAEDESVTVCSFPRATLGLSGSLRFRASSHFFSLLSISLLLGAANQQRRRAVFSEGSSLAKNGTPTLPLRPSVHLGRPLLPSLGQLFGAGALGADGWAEVLGSRKNRHPCHFFPSHSPPLSAATVRSRHRLFEKGLHRPVMATYSSSVELTLHPPFLDTSSPILDS